MVGVGFYWRTFGGEKDGGEIHEHFTHYQHAFLLDFVNKMDTYIPGKY